MSQPNVLVFIGRFSPVHKAHTHTMKLALQQADRLIIAIGSTNDARNTRNPWTFEERVDMIKLALTGCDLDRVTFIPLRDYPYDNLKWRRTAEQMVHTVVDSFNLTNPTVGIIGCTKDESSWYIRYFPKWQVVSVDPYESEHDHKIISATPIREGFLLHGTVFISDNAVVSDIIHPLVSKYLIDWTNTPMFVQMNAEMGGNVAYQQNWRSAPYAPTIVTADCVVLAVKDNVPHILLVTRKKHPGIGLYALPGGHIEPHETLEQAGIRELFEETQIQVDYDIRQFINSSRVFDYPQRSQRARVITSALFIHLPTQFTLPPVTAADDAASVQWVPVKDIGNIRSSFFEDHFHIISHFINIEEK